ncbi:MAG: transcriptional regulator [Balneola sp.]|nr:transcriptional regulator [Balneola sp.]MBE79206.1 transcriptional regulator [Balneola sp.]
MLLSKSCVYGLRASLYLASRREGDYTSIREMSDELEISFHFLTKILQQLTADSLMESYKGPNGGIRLSAKGERATLLDVVIAIDGPGLFTQCALGLPGCGSATPCPLHDSWLTVRESIKDMLERTNLKELAREGKANKFRITAEGSFSWQ